MYRSFGELQGRVSRYHIVGTPAAPRSRANCYLGTDCRDGAAVELRLYPSEGHHNGWEQYADEALSLVQRIRHEHVAALVDYGWHREQFFVACELVQGPSLREVAHRAQRSGISLPVSFVAHVGARVARDLHAGHVLEVAPGEPLCVRYRQLGASDIGFDRHGVVKLLDWGLQEGPPGLSARSHKVQVPAPEEVRGVSADARADLFQLSALLFHVLSGSRMFPGETDYEILKMILDGYRPDFAAAMPSVPAGFRDILAMAASHQLEDRYRTAAELADALEPWAEGFSANDTNALLSSLALHDSR